MPVLRMRIASIGENKKSIEKTEEAEKTKTYPKELVPERKDNYSPLLEDYQFNTKKKGKLPFKNFNLFYIAFTDRKRIKPTFNSVMRKITLKKLKQIHNYDIKMFDKAFNPQKFIDENDSEDDMYLAEYEIPKFHKVKVIKQIKVNKTTAFKRQ